MNSPFLYIFMRTDLASMNAGKAVAQGAHAANMFQTRIACLRTEAEQDNVPTPGYVLQYEQWLKEGVLSDGFGTTITLECNGEQLDRIVKGAWQEGLMAGVVKDPTYPLRDGEVTHLIPLDTCGFVFGRKADLAEQLPELSTLNLMGVCGKVKHSDTYMSYRDLLTLHYPGLKGSL